MEAMNNLTEHRTALVVVDVQNGFVNHNSDIILPAITRLLGAWPQGAPLFFTKFQNLPDSNWEKMIGWKRLRNEPEIDLHPSIQPFTESGDIVEKVNMYSSLTGSLLKLLDSGTIDTVAVCGIATESCVLATALAIFEYQKHSVRPLVLTDAVASHAGDEPHRAGMLTIERFIGRGQLCTVDSFLGWRQSHAV